MKLLLLADGAVGLKFTQFIVKNYPDDLALIVTTHVNEIYLEAEGNNIRVCVFDSETNVLDKIGSGIDLGILAWWPSILRSPLLDTPRQGFVNTHPSLLPHNRGKHFSFWAIVEQAPFGVTLHRVDDGVDSGDIVIQSSIAYDWCDTGGTLYEKAQEGMMQLLMEVYPALREGEFASFPQSLDAGSFHYASELESASKINLSTSYRALDLLNLLRARTFEGRPGCWFEEDGNRYEISVNIRKIN